MTIRVRLGKLAVVAALAAAGTITTGAAAAHADDCHTSVTCGVSEDAGTYEPGSECPPKTS
ncbi:hypothetical protein G3I76_10235 [Streptomyces sp. SID11233]|nr:hypothetical protein [Streptomyces sp. SID11233]